MDRRQALKTLVAAAAAHLAAQTPPQATQTPANPKDQRRAPPVILFSQNLIQIEYPELGDIVRQMGFDGVDLTIRPGGHVEPRLANVDLVRAFEVMNGEGLGIPVITTAITTPTDRTAVPVIALAGMSGARVFRTGYWPYGTSPNIMMRLGEVQRDFSGLMGIGRQYTIAGAFHNQVGDNVGAAIWDVQRIIEPLDPAWAGFYFDICNATAEGGGGDWEIALRLAMPRIKAVSIQDFFWEKQNGKWQMTKCPLGQGMVDWSRFFQMLAQANYPGPVTVEAGYPAKDMPSALVADLQFARKQLQAAWGINSKT
jgi:L-ribulose-5-phosphate 3-epimerase